MIEYMFTYMRRGNGEVPIVRLQATTEQEAERTYEIGKHYSVVIEQPDIIISHEFVIKNPIKSEQVGEYFYKWYQLEYYSKSVDRSNAVKAETEQNSANIDYLSMMVGIDLPNEAYTEPEEE